MDSIGTIKVILDEIAKQISQLPEADIKKIEDGSHEISIKLVKKMGGKTSTKNILESLKNEVLLKLSDCSSREEGHFIIAEAFKNKSELEQFAKYLDVLVLKQDKVDQIKDKIIEATVGAKLRSNAIQGKT